MSNKKATGTNSSSRMEFDDDDTLERPQDSLHWQNLVHHEGDHLIQNIAELLESFRSCLKNLPSGRMPDEKDDIQQLALWSCITGYAEALATNKQRRYEIFPIPIDALKRIVTTEFLPFLEAIKVGTEDEAVKKNKSEAENSVHRRTVRSIANAVWAQAIPKPNVRDEQHANSLYVCFRGKIDKKSLDCFGAAVVTVIGCLLKDLKSSRLTLSEDHAYERHTTDEGTIGTCEVAVPGTTQLAQSKRGREISHTFSADVGKSKNQVLTPETSWLYMASNPVVCDSIPMMIVAIVGNINCTIAKTSRGSLASRQLYILKRDLLWELWEQDHMSRFPFGLIELGDCEEHCGSDRSSEWVSVAEVDEPILMNEKLFHDAIQINKALYNESQAYPYFYSGHYHKDAGNEGPEHEYRLVFAMKDYADAARVASKYTYEGADSIQLNKHLSSVCMLIGEDILTPKYKSDPKEKRQWHAKENAVAVCTWLLGYFDSLLLWEEKSGSKQFCEVLSPSHKYSIGKLFQHFSDDIRKEAISIALDKSPGTVSKLPFFKQPKATRLSVDGLLLKALLKPKVAIREMELAIPSIESDLDVQDGGRRSKRARRK